jgi:PAS domain S-box-containing protein
VTVAPEDPAISVVLVDDSTEVRALARRRLEMSGLFEIVGEAGDGDQAIGLVYRHEPDLLLLDTSMPTMDGIEALPAILALCPETTVVMFTGFEDKGLAARARELGAADFIEKSIPLEELPERLLRIMDGASSAPGPSPRHGLSVVGAQTDAEQRALAAEQAVLTEHIGQFRELFDQAAIGMAVLTVTGTIVRANGALAVLMSCGPYDLVGVDYGRLTGGRGDQLDRGLESISSGGQDLATFEHPVPGRPADDPHVVRVTLAPIRDSTRQVLYVFGQIQDISAQRAAEADLRHSQENFRRLVSAVKEYAIFMLDADGCVVSWNAGAQRIKGYAAHEIVGRSFRVFYPPEDQETRHPERNLEAALRDGTYAEEGWRVRKDGSRFWASVVISPVYDDAGAHVGFAKVTRDQSAQRDHEGERGDFLGQQTHLLEVTAHELRMPTAVIDGSAGMLRESWDQMAPTEREELLTGIRGSAHRLRRLASDLATASRLHGETLQFRFAQVSLPAIVRDTARRRQTAEADVEIGLGLQDEIVVDADEVRLAQALDNLLDNAIRHGAPPITVVGEVVDDEVRIRVTDAGPGVPADLVPRLFDRFAIGGPSGGTGLGLYLVSEIARGHGGQAAYHPPGPGRQVEFEIRIPRRLA